MALFAASESEPLIFSGNAPSDLSAQLALPYEDILQLEWLSNFMEDCFSGGSVAPVTDKGINCAVNKEKKLPLPDDNGDQFQTYSPVSVLESSSSTTQRISHHQRARSKRPRPSMFNPCWPAIQIMSQTSFLTDKNHSQYSFPVVPPLADNSSSQESENFAELSNILIEKIVPKVASAAVAEHDKKKKKKVKLSSSPVVDKQMAVESSSWAASSSQSGLDLIRKCMHCEITETPQWRAGPMGPKTLCNACGVRYKSGRLFPEYRPAASPTFVASLHSNSHKKVLQMRNNNIVIANAAPPEADDHKGTSTSSSTNLSSDKA